MSRIDQAFRRAGDSSDRSPSGRSRQAAFDSPWQIDGENEKNDRITDEPSVETSTLAEDVSRSTIPAARIVADFRTGWREWLAPCEQDPSIYEQFRGLAAALLHARRNNRLRVIMVTSAQPGEGKTMTALNLGVVFADSYKRRVLLIDADLRRPRLSEAVRFSGEAGLGDVLRFPDTRKVSLVQLTQTLALLPAGAPDPDPLSVLSSSHMSDLLDEAATRFDWVIVDTPPAGACADAGLLCSMVDATVLVVQAGVTPYEAVQNTVEALGRERIFGVVLNGVDRAEARPYGHYYSSDPAAGTA